MTAVLEEVMVKGAISYARAHPSGTPRAVVDAPWDGSAEVKAASVDDLKVMCAWVDGAGEAKGDYKLPHHKQAGNHSVVWKAVSAAMAALNGARTPMSIPSADRRGVYGHLVRHYREFDKEPPALKLREEDADNGEITKEHVVFSAQLLERKRVGTEFYASGFASLNTEDRQGDVVEPSVFDLSTFMRNPQLWVNHRLWQDGNGNGVSAGIVESIQAVRVRREEPQGALFLYDLKTDQEVRQISLEQFSAVKDGAKGLWLVCKIAIPEVAKLIQDGRLNAFSWQGTIYRRKTGTIAKIDLYEVSLVNVPANQYATLQVGKELTIQPLDGSGPVVIDLDAVGSLLPDGGGQHALEASKEEQELMDALEIALTPRRTAGADEEGGDEMDSKLKEMLGSITEKLGGLDKIDESLDALGKRISTLEAAAVDPEKKKAEDEAKAKADADAKQKAEDEAKVKAEADAKAKADAEAEIKSSDTDKVLPEVTQVLTVITEKLAALDKIQAGMDALGTRVEGLERKPAAKAAISDDGAAARTAKVEKQLTEMTPEDRKRAHKRVLAARIVPQSVVKGSLRGD